MTARRYTYVDFTKEKQVPLHAKTTMAIATAANDQEDFFRIGNNYFELHQSTANTLLAANGFAPAATGWLVPCDQATEGIQITQGMVAGVATPMKFVVGTDAFFIKVKAVVTTLANYASFAVGFRELGAYVTWDNAAEAITSYDEKIIIKSVVTSGITSYTQSLATVDSSATMTGTPIVTATAFTWEVRVDSAGLCTAYVDGVADTIFNAAALTITDTSVMIPHVGMCGNATGASNVQLVTYECGLLNA